MTSLVLSLCLLGGSGQRLPEDPTLLVVLQIPDKGGDPVQLSLLDWATGREHWSSSLPLPQRPEGGGYVLVAGSDLWTILMSKSQGDLLVAVDLATGRERFRIAGHYLGAPPAEGSKAILFHQGGDGVVAIDPATGAELWRRRDLVALGQWGAVVGSHMVVPVGDTYLSLDPVSGETRWKIPEDNGYLEDDGELIWTARPAQVGLDPKTGAERRRLKVPEGGTFYTMTAGKAYFRTPNRLEAVRLSDAAPAWSQPLDPGQTATSVWEHKGRVQVLEHPSNRTLCLDAKTGQRVCRLDFPASDTTSTSMRTNRVGARWFDRGPKGYVHLCIFDVLRGRFLWKGEADEEWGSTVRDEVYVATGREVFRVDVDAGGARWTVQLPEAPSAKVAGPGCTVVRCADRLLCFSAYAGQPLWEARLPQAPATVILGATPLR